MESTSYTFPVQTGGIFYFPWHRHQYVQSEHNIADIFTKPANKVKLGKFAPIRGC